MEKVFPQLWIGFTGVVSYRNAHATRDALLAVKKAKILMETDAPYLPPQPFRGKTNYPEYVKYVYEYCAELLGISLNSFERQIAQSFSELFGIKNE